MDEDEEIRILAFQCSTCSVLAIPRGGNPSQITNYKLNSNPRFGGNLSQIKFEPSFWREPLIKFSSYREPFSRETFCNCNHTPRPRSLASDLCSRRTDEWDKIYPIRLSVIYPYNHTARVRGGQTNGIKIIPFVCPSSIPVREYRRAHRRAHHTPQKNIIHHERRRRRH